MLILNRKVGEKIIIDGKIMVMISAINGQQVSVGVEAPKNIIVHREEVFLKIIKDSRIQSIAIQARPLISFQQYL